MKRVEPQGDRAELNRRLRHAFIDGVEELERVLRWYPGDLPKG